MMANEAWARVAQFMRRMNERIPTYVLEGNHDMSASGDGTSTVMALDGLVHAVTKPQVIKIGRYKVGWLPYVEDPEQVRTIIKAMKADGARSIIGHLGIGDPKLSKCLPTDYETPGRINVSDLSSEDFDQVFLSHYHTPQDLAPNARYLGSPLQLSYKEANEVKGFWIHDTDTNEVEWVENTDSPRFHKLTENAAVAQLAHGEIPDRDFIWITDATREGVEDFRKIDRPTPLRIDLAPTKVHVESRLSDEAKTDDEVLAEFVRVTKAEESAEEQRALVLLGKDLSTTIERK